MLERKLACQPQPADRKSPPTLSELRRATFSSLRSAKVGVPCGSCTHLNGFADRCLGCSANGTFKCRVQSAECRAEALASAQRCFYLGFRALALLAIGELALLEVDV